MKKVLVIQYKIGNGSLQSFLDDANNNEFYNFEKNILIPSVKKWSEKCGYDYKFIEKDEPTILDSNFFDVKIRRIGSILCERFFHLYQQDYDYVIYIDTDVFVTNSAGLFEINSGISVSPDYVNTDMHRKYFYDKYHINESDYTYVNSGVIGIDKNNAKLLLEYFLNKIYSGEVNQRHEDIWCYDQDILNYFLFLNKHKINYLDTKWNFIAHRIDKEKIENNPFFIHFTSLTKKIFRKYFKKYNVL